MKKNIQKICLVIALGALSTAASAEYNACRHNGGGFWACAYAAAMNDRIAPPTGQQGDGKPLSKYTESQFKNAFIKNIEHCNKLPVNGQLDCISKGVSSKPIGKILKPTVAVSAAQHLKPQAGLTMKRPSNSKVISKSLTKNTKASNN